MAAAATVALACAASALAFAPAGPPGGVRVSTTGADGDTTRTAVAPVAAYNPKRGEYLVVWEADGLATDNEFEIFGRRLNRAGQRIGPQLRISTTGTDGDANRDATDPAVTYNPRSNQYLVVWVSDGLATDNEMEIFGQRLGPTGAELGEDDFRISTTGADGDADRDAFAPAVAYNNRLNQYLVTWHADGLATDNENEIFGQRLGAGGAEIGGDFRISTTGVDGDANRDASNPTVAHSPRLNQYLVVWQADGLPTDNELEIFGQRLGAGGAEIGEDDFRISTTGSDADADRGAFRPVVAHNPRLNQYLVAWEADGLATDNEFEIFSQRLGGAGAALGGDFRISTTGADGDANRDAFNPTVAHSPRANEYLVAWEADGLATDDELEIFGQRVGAGGKRLDSNLRVSRTGPDGDADREVFNAALAFGANQYLVSWSADGLPTDDEFEVFARRLRSPRCAGVPATLIGTKGADVLRGGKRRDVIVGLAGNDRLLGLGGNDLLCGGPGRDVLLGGAGADRLFGGPGLDALRGGPGRDRAKQ